MAEAEIGVFGGSGFYSLLEGAEEITVETPYGAPSDMITVGEIAGRKVAFLPRHGRGHQFPPHMINYRANLAAMKQLGVKRLLGPAAAGSLQPHIRPGDFVLCDQLIDRTTGRRETFFDGPETMHISFADPYCPQLREVAWAVIQRLGLSAHRTGTVVVIQGPRFSTRSESRWFRSAGWEVINMTQYPEAVLAREAELCYVNISLITDYDVGVEGDPRATPVTAEEVLRIFGANLDRLRQLITALVAAIPADRTCACGTALAGARG
ncbi:MAG: S-methyl-5'-thioadenosine phosphorylase [Armatimonadetes bacterium]|nr:S-methyl-5'-thioadenosine phosphorylase [Armatimonadota bacterium]